MVYSSDGTYYKLLNDLGKEIEVHETHFIPLDKWREKKLKDFFKRLPAPIGLPLDTTDE
jgi:hypothetical protein